MLFFAWVFFSQPRSQPRAARYSARLTPHKTSTAVRTATPREGTPESRNCYEFLGFYGLIEVALRNWFQCQRTATKKE